MSVTLRDIQQAHERIAPLLHRTPTLTSSSLDALAGAQLVFKAEHLQKTGSFKARGAVNAVLGLSDWQGRQGVATHSSGNHGAALAWAAKARNLPAYIVVPNNAPAVKKANISLHGASIIDCQATLAAREACLAQTVARTGAEYIPPYDDLRIIAGQGTAALELLQDCPDLDALIVPVGGGGLLAGCCLAASSVPGSPQVFGAEPAMADDAFRSFTTGLHVTEQVPHTIADGLRATLGVHNFALISEHAAGILTVSEDEIVAAMGLLWQRLKQVIEPSGAVALAAALRCKAQFADQRVGVFLTGGNVSLPTAATRPPDPGCRR